MTTEQRTVAINQARHLYVDNPGEVWEIFRANGRYGTSWYLGGTAAEQSISVANRIKNWLGAAGRGEAMAALVLVDTEVDYVLGNLEAARDNPTDPHRKAAEAVLQGIEYIEPAELLAIDVPQNIHLVRAS